MENYINLINSQKFTIKELEHALSEMTFVSTRDGFDNRPFVMNGSRDLDVKPRTYIEGIAYVDKFNYTRDGLVGEFFIKSSMGMKKFLCLPLYGDNGEEIQASVFTIGTFKETFTKVFSRSKKDPEDTHKPKPFVINFLNIHLKR